MADRVWWVHPNDLHDEDLSAVVPAGHERERDVAVIHVRTLQEQVSKAASLRVALMGAARTLSRIEQLVTPGMRAGTAEVKHEAQLGRQRAEAHLKGEPPFKCGDLSLTATREWLDGLGRAPTAEEILMFAEGYRAE